MELKRKVLDKDVNEKPGAEKDPRTRIKIDISEPQHPESVQQPLSGGIRTAPERDASETGAGDVDVSTNEGRKLLRSKNILLLLAALVLLIAFSGFFLIRSKSNPGSMANASQKLEPITSIIRPIPQPDYREMMDFLLTYELEGQNMITAMRMEISFQSPIRYRNFKEQNVAFSDAVYIFLLKQNLYGNSVKAWHPVVEKDLLDCLKVKLPQSYPDKIRLTQVENL